MRTLGRSGRPELESIWPSLGPRSCWYSIAALSAAIAAVRTLLALSLVDTQRASIEIRTIESLHGARRVRIRHLYETEPTWVAGVAVGDQRQAFDRTVLRKQSPYGILGRRERKIANI